MATGIVAAYVTVPNSNMAHKIANSLVEKKLAACVNIIPGVKSVYRWEEKVTEDSELLLMIKTRKELIGDLIAEVKSLHSYTCPEVIATEIVGGNQQYLNWVLESTNAPSRRTSK